MSITAKAHKRRSEKRHANAKPQDRRGREEEERGITEDIVVGHRIVGHETECETAETNGGHGQRVRVIAQGTRTVTGYAYRLCSRQCVVAEVYALQDGRGQLRLWASGQQITQIDVQSNGARVLVDSCSGLPKRQCEGVNGAVGRVTLPNTRRIDERLLTQRLQQADVTRSLQVPHRRRASLRINIIWCANIHHHVRARLAADHGRDCFARHRQTTDGSAAAMSSASQRQRGTHNVGPANVIHFDKQKFL